MSTPVAEFEATWEEIAARRDLAGKRLKVAVLEPPPVNGEVPADQRHSTAADLLPFAGTWEGDDFEECLRLVYETRSQARF
jgi:hypothetical protein